jgi:UDP-3-O-[3-hydroxymyristoyl] glucosamine N-acyltransferase
MPVSTSKHSLADLSGQFGLQLLGDGKLLVDGVGTLASAGPSQVAFLANPAYRKQLPSTRAGAVILKTEDSESCPTNCLLAPDPYVAYARIATLFDQRPAAKAGIHATAVIADTATVGKDVSIGANAVIAEDCIIGDGCTIGPCTVLDTACRLDKHCRLGANVTLGHGVQLGKRVLIHPGVVIGADGFGIAFDTDHWEKVPQLGSVVIGDDCEIGANTCIDRGAVGDTVLEEDVRIDNLCQVGHNVRIGAHTAIAGNSGIAGSTKIGSYCLIGGGAGISGHLEIADRTTINGGSQVFHSISEPGKSWSGHLPSTPIHDWNRNLARLRKLDELARKVRALELKMEK